MLKNHISDLLLIVRIKKTFPNKLDYHKINNYYNN